MYNLYLHFNEFKKLINLYKSILKIILKKINSIQFFIIINLIWKNFSILIRKIFLITYIWREKLIIKY